MERGNNACRETKEDFKKNKSEATRGESSSFFARLVMVRSRRTKQHRKREEKGGGGWRRRAHKNNRNAKMTQHAHADGVGRKYSTTVKLG